MEMKAKNIIEINGRVYDANTGKPLKQPVAKTKTTVNQIKTKNSLPKGKFIDGLQRPVGYRSNQLVKSSKSTTNKTAAAQSLKTTVAKSSRSSISRSSAPKAAVHPKHSTTLHRRAVKMPNLKNNEVQKSEAKAPTAQTKKYDSKRLERAGTIKRSNAIQRFHRTSTPASQPTGSALNKDQTSEAAVLGLTHHLQTTNAKTESKKEQLIAASLKKATLQPTHHKATKQKVNSKKRLLRFSSSALVVLMLAGYVAYLNVPGISMKVAAHRAGFAANLPGYKPAGYSLSNPISYQPGQVTINFHSNTDERRFSLLQQPSSWDSNALRENYVQPKDENYVTYQDNGLTIYVYNGSNASWVNGGKLYHIDSKDSQLDTEQLLNLATSM